MQLGMNISLARQSGSAPIEVFAPADLIVTTNNATTIGLSWTNTMSPVHVGNIEIQRSTDGVNFSFLAVVANNATTYSNTGLTNFTEYHYRIRYSLVVGIAPGNVSPFSNVVHTITQVSISTSSVVVNNWNNITVQYSGVGGSRVGYHIERSTDNVNFTQVGSVVGSGTTYTDTSCDATSVNYYYRVKAYSANFVSNSSNSVIGTKSADLTTFLTFKARVEADGGFLRYIDTRANVDDVFIDTIAWARTNSASFDSARIITPAYMFGVDPKLSTAYGLDPINPATVINLVQATAAAQPDEGADATFRRSMLFDTATPRRIVGSSSDFTNTSSTGWAIGFWMYNGTPAATQHLFNKGATGSTPGTAGFRIRQTTSRTLEFVHNATTTILPGFTPVPVNGWTFIFLHCTGTTIRHYQYYGATFSYFGTATAAVTGIHNIGTASPFVIGGRGDGTSQPYGGYIGHVTFLQTTSIGNNSAGDNRVMDLINIQKVFYGVS